MEAILKKTSGLAELGKEPDSNSASLERLYADHASWLQGTLRRRYGAEAADELTQETFIRVANRGETEQLRNARAYLLRVAQNLAKNRGRDSKRRATESLDERHAQSASQPSSQFQTVILSEIVLALPSKLRDVFVLRHLRGMSLQETADLLGISVKAVDKRLAKARALCAAAMRD